VIFCVCDNFSSLLACRDWADDAEYLLRELGALADQSGRFTRAISTGWQQCIFKLLLVDTALARRLRVVWSLSQDQQMKVSLGSEADRFDLLSY
jgi:hypothetical protein